MAHEKSSPLSTLLTSKKKIDSALFSNKNLTPNKVEFLFKKQQTVAERLALSGFKSPNDLADFLKTPAGKSVESSIHEHIMQDIALMNEHLQNELDKQVRRERLLAYLHLYRLIKQFKREQFYRKDTEQQIKSIAQRQETEKKAHTSLKNDKSQKSLTSLPYPTSNDIYKANQLFLEDEIEQNLIELELLEMELAQFEFEENLFIFQHEINKAYEYSTLLDNLGSEEKLQAIEKMLSQVAAKIADHEQAIIAQLTPDAAIEEYKSPKLEGLQARKQIFEEIRAQLLGKKSFYDERGEITSSHQKAQFILEEGMKLVKYEGKLYLMPKSQDFTSLNETEKNEAQKKFELEKPKLSNINQVVKNNHPINTSLHQEKREALASRSEEKLKTLLDLYNQLTNVNSLLASTSNIQDMAETAPVPRPSPKPTSTKESDLELNVAKKALNLLRMTPNEKMVKLFIDNFSMVKGKFETQLNQFLTDTIQPGQRLSFLQMQLLLKTIERFGVSAYKENITATPKPAPDYTPPSPFSMKPKPPGGV